MDKNAVRRLIAALVLLANPVALGDSVVEADATEIDLSSLASLDFDFSESILPGMLQDEPTPDDTLTAALDHDAGWGFEVNPFLWALTLDADVTVDGFTASVDLDFSDLLDALDGAFMTQLRATYGDWTVEVNAVYAKIGLDGKAKSQSEISKNFAFAGAIERERLRRTIDIPVDAEVQVDVGTMSEVDVGVGMKLTIIELFAGYRVFTHDFENGATNPFTQKKASFNVTPYGGARLTWLDIELDVRLSAAVEVDAQGNLVVGRRNAGAAGNRTIKGSRFFELDAAEFWPDAVIGLDLALLDLGRWNFSVRGDVGGFGIGESSDFVWGFGGKVMYQLKRNIILFAGYHILDYDYGDETFGVDGSLEGPVLGGSIQF